VNVDVTSLNDVSSVANPLVRIMVGAQFFTTRCLMFIRSELIERFMCDLKRFYVSIM
jgi:hypothetical protein